MMQHAVQQGLTHFSTAVLLAIIAACALRPARVDPFDGELTLSYSWPLRIITWVSFLVYGGLAVAILVVPPRNAQPAGLLFLLILVAVFGLLAALGGFYAVQFTWERIRLGAAGITRHSAGRLPRTIAWEDVTCIAHRPVMKCFRVTGRDGTTIEVHDQITGILDFRAQIRQRLPAEVYRDAQGAFLRLESLANF